MRRTRLLVAALAASLLLAGGYFLIETGKATQKAEPAKGASRGAPVVVANVVTHDIPVQVRTIGTVQARATVEIKSLVDGQIVEAAFHEGQAVHKGDLLFRIDPRPFEAQLRQAEANLARSKAQMQRARADLTRYEELSQRGFSSQQKYEEARAVAGAMAATIRADEAAVEMARLQLGYTAIHAPIDGRTGNLLVSVGNLVEANEDPPLVVIKEIKPIHLTFSVPEHYLSEVRKRMAEGPMNVAADIPQDGEPSIMGRVFFINNAVDPTTGTIQLKAIFENMDEKLTPGQFVDVILTLSTLADAVVVPSHAVQNGQNGNFVFVVTKDLTVEQRRVELGPEVDGRTVIEKGLAVGERVVTDGQLRLYPGARVEVKTAATS